MVRESDKNGVAPAGLAREYLRTFDVKNWVCPGESPKTTGTQSSERRKEPAADVRNAASKRRDPTELERLLWATAITAALIAWLRAAGARQSLVEGAKKPSSSFAAGAAGAAAPLPADS
jgi:hypothetical protein